jgi:hypothetical protein
MSKIAIIGAGVAGATTALCLSKLGLEVTVFEKEQSPISGPPFCHLHAGGNLYREISDEQCVKLLKQSIDFLKFYPYTVDYRPTLIVVPKSDPSTPKALLPRLNLIQDEYKKLIEADSSNEVLGKYSNYFKLYSKEKLTQLKELNIVEKPQNSDEWLIPVAKNLEFEKVQFPLVLVQEYGLNLFRLASSIQLQFENINNIEFYNQATVVDIDKDYDSKWLITYSKNSQTQTKKFDYIVNSAGFRSGKVDDMVGAECKSMVEFKAAYISRWEDKKEIQFPEIIFHGQRGTPNGMGQFTPYPFGYFQLHGMTHDITLYDEGLVSNSTITCQPKLKDKFLEKIEGSWSKEEIEKRTNSAIKHISKYLPNFSEATVGAKPLFGAQQIPGDDPNLRVAEVSFPLANYARCEIVKVSSSLDMVDAIEKDLIKNGHLNKSKHIKREPNLNLLESNISSKAKKIAKERNYPEEMSSLTREE